MNNILVEDALNILEENLSWEKLKGKNVLVTGATGMIGSYVTRTLVQLRRKTGWDIGIYVLVRNRNRLPEDLKDEVLVIEQSVDKPIESDAVFNYVVHAASPASPKIMKDDPVGTIAANTLGTFYTLDAARRSNADGYLFISSREIYGQPYEDQREFTEETYGFVDPLSPRSCYPEGKKAAETMCASFRQQYGLEARIARLAHTYGPGMSIDDGRVQADFIRDVVNNRDIVMLSEGKPIRTYTYVGDAVSAMFRILLDSDDLAYNIASEASTVSIRQLAETLIEAFPERGLKLVIDIPEPSGNTGCAPFTLGILNSDKLRGLGWKERYDLKTGLKRTVEYIETR